MKIHCQYSRVVPISELKPHPKNRNQHTDEQITRLAYLLGFYGVRAPIVVSLRSGFIVKGHGTLQAIKLNKWTEAPVSFQDFGTDEEEYGYLQADNAIAAWASLDLDAIKTDFKEFNSDFDVNLLGIQNFSLGGDGAGGTGDEDDVPETPDAPRSRGGDIFSLGKHRILCGDSTKAEDVARLMSGVLADMVFTDPPYNVNYEAQGQTIQNDNMSDDAFLEFCRAFFKSYNESMKDGASIYVFHAGTEVAFLQAFKESGFHISCTIIWNKSSLKMGRSDYHWKHEPCLYGWKEGAAHSWYSDRKQTTVYDHDKGSGEDNKMHPTCKPVSLVEYFMGNSSKAGDLVLDLFLGSGSTLVCAEKMGRVCYGMELDPKYFDVILERWAKFTGKDPVREDGLKWSEIKNANG